MATLIVHGGAGPMPANPNARLLDAGLERAIAAGWAALPDGAVAAVAAAVRVLEDDPHFNAGTGGVLTAAGTVELDAGIMDGAGLRVGAVAAVRDVRNPVALAEAVMADGRHVLIVAEGASRFADAHGIQLVNQNELIAAAAGRKAGEGDTVGAVCLDEKGHVAVAVSTGGTRGQQPGRVGDTPICGAGFYAHDGRGAACSTGEGEAFIRLTSCKRVVDLLGAGLPAQPAAERAIAELGARVGGAGGVIVVDADGAPGIAHNTAHMSWAWRNDSRTARWSDSPV